MSAYANRDDAFTMPRSLNVHLVIPEIASKFAALSPLRHKGNKIPFRKIFVTQHMKCGDHT